MEKTHQTTQTHQTHLEPDLHCAGFLIAKGYSLLGLERVGRRFAFQFSPEAHTAAQEYRSGSGTVVGRVFADALTRLKDELFAAKFSERNAGNRNGENAENGQYPRR